MQRTGLGVIGATSAAVVALLGVSATSAYAVDWPDTESAMHPSAEQPADVAVQEQNGISYINGGVAEQREAFERVSNRFNFKLTLATPSGKFNMAALRIEDQQGRTFIELPNAGPLFLAKLSPGTYTVRLSPADGPPLVRTVSVPSSGQEKLAITIPDHSAEPSRAGDAPE